MLAWGRGRARRVSLLSPVPPRLTFALPSTLLPLRYCIGHGTFLWPNVNNGRADEVEHAVEAALKAGYRHIDCADAYGNHTEVGAAFKKVFSDPNGPKREDVWITTKLNNPDHEPSKAGSASSASCLRLVWTAPFIPARN